MGVRSFDAEFEADADESGLGIVKPDRCRDVLEKGLGRTAVHPPPQNAGRPIYEIGDVLGSETAAVSRE